MPPRISALPRFAIAVFATQFVALDVILRGRWALAGARAWAGAGASVAAWTLLASMRGRRPARAVVAIFAGALFASQVLFVHYWHTPIDAQITAAAAHSWSDVRRVLVPMLPRILAAVALASCAEYTLLSAPIPARPRPALALAAFALALPFALPLRDATPDLRLLDALHPHPASAAASPSAGVTIPPLESSRDRLPDVLFVLTESVRASDACSAHGDASCEVTPRVDAVFPDRAPLREMRAVASYTAVSLSAIVTGHTQEGSRDAIEKAPTLFELVRAVRAGGRSPTVAYFSAQAATVFERDVHGAIDTFVSLESLVGHAVEDEDSVIDQGVDRLLAARFTAALPSLEGPRFVMLHFAGTHAPYFVNDDDAPFRPYSRTVAWSKMDQLHRAYQDAIHEQDKSIAACLRAFALDEERRGAPWLIVFTSDHGEAFGEHGAIHHGQSLYEEQIHVPAWVAFGGGAIDEDQARNLRAHENAHVTHLDVLPTILEAYGVLDAFPMRPYARALRGRSLFADDDEARPPIAMTNCTAMFPCPLDTWGMLDGDYAMEAQKWDDDWHCVRFSTGEERLNGPICDRLRAASTSVFLRMPNGRDNR